MSPQPLVYLDAARNTQLRQLAGRARRLVPPRVLAAGVRRRRLEEFTEFAAGLGADPTPQWGDAPAPELTGVFSAYGESRPAGDAGFWSQGQASLLFLFYLHGFAALAQYAAGERSAEGDAFWAAVVESWLVNQRQPALPGWHPFPTSGRIIAWCSALGALDGWPAGLRRRLAGEIAAQARYLRRTVEYDIGGNHVLKNAAALIFAGTTTPGAQVLARGLELLRRQLAIQILPDGAHEELSTSYHREVCDQLDAVAELRERAGGGAPGWLTDAVQRTGRWRAALTGPDGRLPLLGDAWEGRPAASRESFSPVTVLGNSGHVVLRHRDDQAVLDCGPLCPPHLPPHAHADALSFVLWIDGEPLVVDPGAASYTGPERAAFRATRAHNTVEVDGQDQCVFWGDFRASLLPRVKPPEVLKGDGFVLVQSNHDGYRRLRDPVIHHRAFTWIPGAGLIVADRLGCRGPHDVRSSLQIAPGLIPDGARVGPLVLAPLGGREASDEPARYSPYLGAQQASIARVLRLRASPGAVFGWALLRPGAAARVLADGAIEVMTASGSQVRVGLPEPG